MYHLRIVPFLVILVALAYFKNEQFAAEQPQLKHTE